MLAEAKGTIVPTGSEVAVVGATPVDIILGTSQFKLPEASDLKNVLLVGFIPGKL